MEQQKKQPSVAVIGGGLAGLSAALYLARGDANLTVHVFEKSSAPGGRARSFERAGQIFNLGAHALYARGAGVSVLNELRVPFSAQQPGVRGQRLIRSGELHALPTTPGSLLQSRGFGVAQKLKIVRVMLAMNRAGRRLYGAQQRRTSVTSGYGAAGLDALASRSIQAWVAEQCADPEVQQFFAGMLRLLSYAADVDRLSADAALIQFYLGGAGVYYLDGGWQTVVDELVAANRAAGVQLHWDSGVAELVDSGDEDASVYDYVVLACDPRRAQRLAGAGYFSDEQIGTGVQPARAACLDVGLTHLPQPTGLVLDFDHRLYLAVHSDTAKLCPGVVDGAVVHLVKYLRAGEEKASPAREQMETLLDRVLPGWREHVRTARYLPRMHVCEDLPVAARGGLAGRQAVDAGAKQKLYFAGDWVGAEGLLSDGAFASARAAAHAILAELRRRPSAAPASGMNRGWRVQLDSAKVAVPGG